MKKLWEKWCKEGLRWPYLHDPVTEKPSVTLLFPYITFLIAVISLISLHFFPQMLIPTGVSIAFWAIAVVFYMIRKINKAKFDLSSQSFELESSTEEAPVDESTIGS